MKLELKKHINGKNIIKNVLMYDYSRRDPNVDNISEYYYNLQYLKGLN
jgi:hypothetical protein